MNELYQIDKNSTALAFHFLFQTDPQTEHRLTSREGQCEIESAIASAASIPSDIPSSFKVFNSFNWLIASQIRLASSAVDIFKFFSATRRSHDTVLSSSISDISISFTFLNRI